MRAPPLTNLSPHVQSLHHQWEGTLWKACAGVEAGL